MGRAAAALAGPVPGVPADRIEALAKAFVEARASVALPGPDAGTGPAARDTALAVALLNYAAGRIGQTVDFSRPHALSGAAGHDEVRGALSGLTSDDVLIVLNANPAHTLSGSAQDARKAGLVVYLGTMLNETAALADWVLPIDSPLESWGDYEPAPGCHGLMQPTMARLYDTRPAGDVLLALATGGGPAPGAGPGASRTGCTAAGTGCASAWRRRRRRRRSGRTRCAGAASGRRARPPRRPSRARCGRRRSHRRRRRLPRATPTSGSGRASCSIDGRIANRGWLQEAPDPSAT